MIPKLKLLYYKNILDVCFQRFFSDFNDDFKNVDGIYVYKNNLSQTKLKSIFKTYIVEELKKYVTPNSITSGDYYFIIGSCLPKNNILLSYKDGYFPAKLDKLINCNYNIKYFLKEKGIKIDLVAFNTLVDEIFIEFFKTPQKIQKYFGQDYTNIFFIQHSRFDCITLYRAVKYIYGKPNTVNLYKEFLVGAKIVIYSINEYIDKYVHNLKVMTNSPEYKLIVKEVEQYIDACIKVANGKKQAKNNLVL